MPRPVELPVAIPFADDSVHRSYDPDAMHRFWVSLVSTQRILQQFRGEFTGKCSPVHFFWGAFDLAVTRFSGRPAPEHPGGVPNCPDRVMHEAYNRELASCGYWPGGADEGAFYAYAYPEPTGYRDYPIRPDQARFDPDLGEFVLPYAAVRQADDPDAVLLGCLHRVGPARSMARCLRAPSSWSWWPTPTFRTGPVICPPRSGRPSRRPTW
jgi:hypothetical protein